MQVGVVSRSLNWKHHKRKAVGSALYIIVLASCLSRADAQTVGIPAVPSAILPPSDFRFTGKSRITAGSETPQPSSSGLPNDFARWEFEPSLSVYEVPIGARVLLTSENDPSRNAMNSVEVIFDVKAFQKMLRDRVMAKATELQGSLKSKAEEMKGKLTDPSMVADLSRYKELNVQDSLHALEGKAKEELESLRGKAAEALAMAATAERYAKMNPAQEAKEKAKELSKLSHDLADPHKLADKLKEMDLFSGVDKLLFGIKELGVGVNYPSYSPMVLSGVPINGAAMEYTYGILTVAGAGGSIGAPLAEGRTNPQMYKRQAYAGKLGIGSTGGSHLHFIGLHAFDDQNSATADSAYSPQENYVLAADAHLDLFEKTISLTGTVAGSMITRDVTAPTLDTFRTGNPTLTDATNRLKPNVSSTVDYAWTAATEFNLFQGATHLKISAQQVGPGYMTLGVPYLRTDIIGREAELEQSLFSGALTLSGYYRKNEDNILPWKRTLVNNEWQPAKTTETSYGGSFAVQPDELPYLRIEYAPFLQETGIDSVDTTASNLTTMISAETGYSYMIGEKQASTTVVAVLQNGTSHGGLYDFTSNYVMLNQSLALSDLSLTAGGSYSKTQIRNVTAEIIGVNGSGTFSIMKDWKGSLGLNYSTQTNGAYKLGYFVKTNVKAFQSHDIEFRAEKNTFDRGLGSETGYDQLRFKMMVTSKW